MDKSHYQVIEKLIEENSMISGFDIYYLGFFSHYVPNMPIEDIFSHMRNIINLFSEDLITNEVKIDLLIKMLIKKIDPSLLGIVAPENGGDIENETKRVLNEYFNHIMKIIPKYSSVNKFELFYIGRFHAIYPSYKIAELFLHINNINVLVSEDLIDEETQIDFLLKILNKKLQSNKNTSKVLHIPQENEPVNPYPNSGPLVKAEPTAEESAFRPASPVANPQPSGANLQQKNQNENSQNNRALSHSNSLKDPEPEKIVEEPPGQEEAPIQMEEEPARQEPQDQVEEREKSIPEEPANDNLQEEEPQGAEMQIENEKTEESINQNEKSQIEERSKSLQSKGSKASQNEENFEKEEEQQEKPKSEGNASGDVSFEEEKEQEKAPEEEHQEEPKDEAKSEGNVSGDVSFEEQKAPEQMSGGVTFEEQKEPQKEEGDIDDISAKSEEEGGGGGNKASATAMEEDIQGTMALDDGHQWNEHKEEEKSVASSKKGERFNPTLMLEGEIENSYRVGRQGTNVTDLSDTTEVLGLLQEKHEENNGSQGAKFSRGNTKSSVDLQRKDTTRSDDLSADLQRKDTNRKMSDDLSADLQRKDTNKKMSDDISAGSEPKSENTQNRDRLDSDDLISDIKRKAPINRQETQQSQVSETKSFKKPQLSQQSSHQDLLDLYQKMYPKAQHSDKLGTLDEILNNLFDDTQQEGKLTQISASQVSLPPMTGRDLFKARRAPDDPSQSQPSLEHKKPDFTNTLMDENTEMEIEPPKRPELATQKSDRSLGYQRSGSDLTAGEGHPQFNIMESQMTNPDNSLILRYKKQGPEENQEDDENKSLARAGSVEVPDAFHQPASQIPGSQESHSVSDYIAPKIENTQLRQLVEAPTLADDVEGEEEEEKTTFEVPPPRNPATLRFAETHKEPEVKSEHLADTLVDTNNSERLGQTQKSAVSDHDNGSDISFDEIPSSPRTLKDPKPEPEPEKTPQIAINGSVFLERKEVPRSRSGSNSPMRPTQIEEEKQPPPPRIVVNQAPKEAEERKTNTAINRNTSQNVNTNACSICKQDLAAKKTRDLEVCHHKFHEDCLREYLEDNVDGKYFPIECPKLDCGKKLRLVDLMEVLDQDYLEDYVILSLKIFTDKNERVVCCPTAGCSYAFLGNNESHFKCPVCKKDYCLKCQMDWHQGVDCKYYENKKRKEGVMSEERSTKKFKKCSKCGTWTPKMADSHVMYCQCGNRFCYTCGQEREERSCECQKSSSYRPVVHPDLFHQ